MIKNLFSKKLQLSALTLFLFAGIQLNAKQADTSPCDDLTVIECGAEYTAVLEPNSGYWEEYTSVPHAYTGSEKVWEFTAPSSGLYVFDVDQGTGDADFFIMYGCSNTAANVTNWYWTGEHEEYIELTEGTTYYIIADLYSSVTAPTTVSIKVNCPENQEVTPPDHECYQGDGIAPSVDEALNLDPINVLTKVADDFTVEPGIEFVLRQITIDTNQIQVPDHAVINIRQDEDGIPGAIVETVEVSPSSHLAWGAAFDEPVYHVVFDLEEPVYLGEGTYWLEPKMTTPEPSTVWWAATFSGSHGAAPMLSEDDGATWMAMEGMQMIFFVAGDCNQLGVNDLTASELTYYPNPVKDILNIQSQKPVKSTEVYDLTGRKLNTHKGTEINMSALLPGVYIVKVTLDNGQKESFKVIKK